MKLKIRKIKVLEGEIKLDSVCTLRWYCLVRIGGIDSPVVNPLTGHPYIPSLSSKG